ncbi:MULTISPECIES: PLDc N-terminal domain-containing protein [unclassified Frigoribacterium]|jgi:ABC-type amino acid transport system permease subunit|uniref:PLDc N-terminal domain-containing protein n=1 Tax=unclassified Frigoribacterium TaxID=2627005 RepID=UPI000A84C6CC|nr:MULTISPECIES: PLDc N-terminal domain-containing protein [unclassified Frigoribacterium]MBD8538195.1 PLDc N-terminal domain-containing protein [Frigoribacterium sp. CFBP 8751]
MSTWGDWGPAVVAIVVAVVYLVIVVSIVRAVRRRADTTQLERTVWTVAAVLFPLGAGAVWLLLGPHPLGLRIDHEQD